MRLTTLLAPRPPPPPPPPPPPLQLLDYITAEFKRIKRKQAELLGIAKQGGSQGLMGGSGGGLSEEERREENRLEPAPPRPPIKAKL